MALLTPEYLQTKRYSAIKDRQLQADEVMQEGIANFGDYAVTQRAAGANMSVDIAAGKAFVQGDAVARQGYYHVVNDAVINAAIAANASGNPRLDQIILRAYDSTDAAQGTDVPAIEVLQGTPTAAATLANRSGAAALPQTALRLADVLVANGAASIANASIGNPADPRAATLSSVAGAPAQYAHGRPLGYVPGCRIERTTLGGIGTATATAVSMDSEAGTGDFDNDNMHAGSDNFVTIRTPGLWAFSLAGIEWAPNATGQRQIWISLTSTGGKRIADDVHPAPSGAIGDIQECSTEPIRLAYGDVVMPVVFQSSGGSLNIVVTSMLPVFGAIWQGP